MLEDRMEELSKFFNINYKHVEKMQNLTHMDKTLESKYVRNADIYLSEFLRLLDLRMKESNKNLSTELYKIEKGLKNAI